MNKKQIIEELNNRFTNYYNINLLALPLDTKISQLSKLNEKIDSIEFLSFIFEIEDFFKINFADEVSIDYTIQNLIDKIYNSLVLKNTNE